MTPAQTASLLTHLALAASGLCLAVAAMPLLPEMPFILAVYLLLISWSWRLAGTWTMPTWAANVVALVIAGGAVGYILLRVHSSFAFAWARDLPVHVAVIPLLGPVLMALLLARLFRSKTLRDVSQLGGIALLQVALGCVLASGTLFGVLLMLYFALALCALAANESRRWLRDVPRHTAAPQRSLTGWLARGLRWEMVSLLVAVPAFLLMPRHDGPEWEPMGRLGQRRPRASQARTGFSDEIDLRRVGSLANDDAVAFTVTMTDAAGHEVATLPAGQRWRGLVLDRYEGSVWRAELSWSNTKPMKPTPLPSVRAGRSVGLLEFRTPGKLGSLFLADPALLGAQVGEMPIQVENFTTRRSLFFEGGGTIVPLTYLPRKEYRYTQQIYSTPNADRYPAVRVGDAYQVRLLRCDVPGMAAWTLALLPRLSADPDLNKAVKELAADPPAALPAGRLEYLPPRHWEQVCRLLCDHLSSSANYTYEMAANRSDLALDPTLDFLMNVRRGPCERYASGLALMLRSVGIPARIVKGFRGWESPGKGEYRIRQRHAHAWVEALVPTAGDGPMQMQWLVLDPTPGGEELPDSPLARWWQQQRLSSQGLWQEMILGYGARRQLSLWEALTTSGWAPVAVPLGALAAVCTLAWLGRRLLRRLRRRRYRLAAPAALFDRLQRLLVDRLQLTTHPGQTPAELAVLAAGHLADIPQTLTLVHVPAAVVEVYYRERFGAAPAAPEEVAALTAEVDRLTLALGKFSGPARPAVAAEP